MIEMILKLQNTTGSYCNREHKFRGSGRGLYSRELYLHFFLLLNHKKQHTRIKNGQSTHKGMGKQSRWVLHPRRKNRQGHAKAQ